jgi:hypothetical protein
MKPETLIVAGGLFSGAFAVFHLFFWKLFRWKTELAKLTALNRAIVQVLNLCLTYVFVVFAYISLAYPSELAASELGRTLLFLIAVFWYLRAIEQIFFFGLRKPLSVLFLVVFLVGSLLYSAALL